ncbi:MAG: hypothetical protein ACRDJO_03835 [Actinomycetota bacterium]
MDKAEARALLAQVIDELRRRSRAELLALSQPECRELIGPSGHWYQVEAQSFWDDKPENNLRVLACIDDGGWRAFSPLCDDFIVAPDGSFVGE